MQMNHATEHVNTVVIGAGQAGLSVGYHLKQLGVPAVILDERQRVGDVWRERWDSLRNVEVANVVWCPGFHPGFSWIDLPIFDADGQPRQERGAVSSEPGLYFVGLHFLYAFSSTMIHGVGRDAERIAHQVALRNRAEVAVGAA